MLPFSARKGRERIFLFPLIIFDKPLIGPAYLDTSLLCPLKTLQPGFFSRLLLLSKGIFALIKFL